MANKTTWINKELFLKRWNSLYWNQGEQYIIKTNVNVTQNTEDTITSPMHNSSLHVKKKLGYYHEITFGHKHIQMQLFSSVTKPLVSSE